MKLQLRMIIAFFCGLAIGWIYLKFIHPLLGGMEGGGAFLERGYAIELIFWGMPIILILVIIATAATFPKSPEETFILAFIDALACLFPIPIFQYFAKAPAVYGRPLFSFFILGNAALATISVAFAAFVIAGITCFLSIWINPLFKKLTGRDRRETKGKRETRDAAHF
jgi:hypothetical protein